MKLTPTIRLVAVALLVFVATAVVWWLVGYQIGKGILGDVGGEGAWTAAYGFRDGGIARLLFLSLLSALALAASGSAQGGARWAILAGLALGAGLVLGLRDGALAATILFVLGIVAIDEAEGFSAQLLAALAFGLLAAFAQELDTPLTLGQAVLAVVLRGALFWFPLLAGPHLAERYVLGSARASARG